MTSRFLPIFLLALAVLSLAACSSTPKAPKCEENKGAYLQAQNAPTLQIPDGNAAPDHHTALKVPDSNGQTINTKACLERAPSYFGSAGRIAASPEEVVADWAQAWADRNSTAVMSMYASQFRTDVPEGAAAWLAQRATDIATGPSPNGRITQLKVVVQGNDERFAVFTQTFGATRIRKSLTLVRDAGVWKISQERVIATDNKSAAKP